MPSNVNRPGFFAPKSVLLAALVGLMYWLVTTAEFGDMNTYALWYKDRVQARFDSMDSLNHKTDIEERMGLRHMVNFFAPQVVAKWSQPGDTILLPPPEYVKQYQEARVYWTDIRFFTYMYGFTSPDYQGVANVIPWHKFNGHNANTFVMITDEPRTRRLLLVRRNDPRYSTDSLLNAYRLSVRNGNQHQQEQQ